MRVRAVERTTVAGRYADDASSAGLGAVRSGEQASDYELEDINQQLAVVLRTKPAHLAGGAAGTLQDELLVCGLLGGKSVGKSTLINALAQSPVSERGAEVGRGTERPTAYVHGAAQAAFEHRMHVIDPSLALDVTLHNADSIRNAVLVDLPDFDSEFPEHLAVVQAVVPVLDRVIWVLTPRKLGDREWIAMFRGVVKDASNVYYVLNKVDELLSDSDLPETEGDDSGPAGRRYGRDAEGEERAIAFWHQQHVRLQRSLDQLGCTHGPERRFAVAAAFPDPDRFLDRIARLWDDPRWSKYESDRKTAASIARLATEELSRLRERVLSPTTDAETQEIKTCNRRQERRINAERIKSHYDLERTAAQIAGACESDYLQATLDAAFGAEYCARVAEAFRQILPADTDLADELLDRRVQSWPLLRLVYWPFGWLARTVGKSRLFSSGTRHGAADRPLTAGRMDGLFEADGLRLVDRIEAYRGQILADHSVIATRLGLESELPRATDLADRLSGAARKLVPQLEQRLLEEIRQNDRKPSLVARGGVWLIFLWFPFVQPVLAGMLEMFAETGSFHLARGLYRIVSAMSATHLLAGFAVVVGVFLGLLAAMYTRALRAVRRQRDAGWGLPIIADAIDGLFAAEVVAPLARPFFERSERLQCLRERLTALGAGDHKVQRGTSMPPA